MASKPKVDATLLRSILHRRQLADGLPALEQLVRRHLADTGQSAATVGRYVIALGPDNALHIAERPKAHADQRIFELDVPMAPKLTPRQRQSALKMA